MEVVALKCNAVLAAAMHVAKQYGRQETSLATEPNIAQAMARL
jgi:hypothetical protein